MVDEVAVCVATFRRPDQLGHLLDALSAQTSRIRWRVYVVDNDPDRSAEGVVAVHPLRPVYIHEPAPGIVAARNAALDASSEAWVAFIDDDEYPDERWLEELVGCMESHHADVVWGPVVSVFPEDTPPWVRDGQFFGRARHATGREFDRAATNNVLTRRSVIEALDLPRFDDRYSASGGSDTHLFHRVWKQGGLIVWCDEAIVFEDVPLSRMTMEWLRRRARRTGNVRGRLLVEEGRRRRAWIEGVARIVLGGLRLCVDRIRRTPPNSRSMNTWMRGWGILDAARGRVVVEYAR